MLETDELVEVTATLDEEEIGAAEVTLEELMVELVVTAAAELDEEGVVAEDSDEDSLETIPETVNSSARFSVLSNTQIFPDGSKAMPSGPTRRDCVGELTEALKVVCPRTRLAFSPSEKGGENSNTRPS